MTKVAAIQMASTSDLKKNVQLACDLIANAAKQGAKLAVLPETFATLGLTALQTFEVAESFQIGYIQQELQTAAKLNKIWLIGGTIPLKASQNKIFSSCLVWDETGECVGRYDKIHLFDVTVEEDQPYCESATVEPGNEIIVQPTPFGKIGIAICYDLRFPELFRVFMLKGADIIVLPSAFTSQTGKAHWEILLKARAIENLCYVIASGEVGFRANGLSTYGHSMVIGPWGETLASLKEGSGVVMAEIDLPKMIQLRQQFPAISHYRPLVMKALMQESQR